MSLSGAYKLDGLDNQLAEIEYRLEVESQWGESSILLGSGLDCQ